MIFKENLHEQLAEERANQRRRRSEAFVDTQTVLCGIPIGDVTLRTYARLMAFQNGFAAPGVPITFADIANFIWIHHPRFGQFNRAARRAVYRAVDAYFHPTFWPLNDIIRGVAPLMRKPWKWLALKLTTETSRSRFDEVGNAITRAMSDALDDWPLGEDSDADPVYAFHAAVLNSQRRMFGSSYAEVMDAPLKQLAQLTREAIHSNTGGKATMFTAIEAALLDEDLRRKTEKAQAALAEKEKAAAHV